MHLSFLVSSSFLYQALLLVDLVAASFYLVTFTLAQDCALDFLLFS